MKYPEFKNADELIAFMEKHIYEMVEDSTNWADDTYIREIHEDEGPIDEYDETYGLSYEDRRGYTDHIVEYREDISDEEIKEWIASGKSRLAEETASDIETLIKVLKAHKDYVNRLIKDELSEEELTQIDKSQDPITRAAIAEGMNDNENINFLFESILFN